MKKILSTILIISIVVGSCLVFAADVYSTELTICTDKDVYSVDLNCSVSAPTDILSVKINSDGCMFDWNYVETDARLYISLASASPIQLTKALVTISTSNDVKITTESVSINGNKKLSVNDTHTETVIPRQPSTEETVGYSEGSVCSVCGAVIESPRELPTVTLQPKSASYRVGKNARELKVDAEVYDGFELEYEWFKNNINSNTGGISVGNGKSYTPSTEAIGTAYYYAVITSVSPGSKFVADTRTEPAMIKVLPESDSMILMGQITSYNPSIEAEISLVADGESVYTTYILPNDGNGSKTSEFCFEEIAPGVYDLVVTKGNHLTYTVKDLSVDDDIDLRELSNPLISNITLISGDVNSDGCIDLKDVTLLTSSNTYGKSYDEATTKAADINGDGCFDLKDLTIITSEKNYGKSEVVIEY